MQGYIPLKFQQLTLSYIRREVAKMKRLCLGTIITLIYQSRTRSADTIKSVCSGIFATYDLDITSYNKELSSHLNSGLDPVPVELIFEARTANIDCVANGIEDNLIPSIENNYPTLNFRFGGYTDTLNFGRDAL